KALIFNAPSDPKRLAAWNRAVPQMKRELRSSDGICEKHFPRHMISVRATHIEYHGRVLLHAPKRPRLSQDAVPCIFPGYPAYRSSARKAKPPRKPPARRSQLSSPARQRRPTSEGSSTSAQPKDSDNSLEHAVAVDAPNVSAHDNRADRTSQGAYDHPLSFSELLKDPHLVDLPGKTWAVHAIAGAQAAGFSSICPKADMSQPHIFEKVLSVSPAQGGGLSVNTFVSGKAIPTDVAIEGIKVTSVRDLARALKAFDRLMLCSGGPMRRDHAQVRTECASVDLPEACRHNRCTFVASVDGQCPACRSL
ncbi:unnamed protein product, partial [Ixodes hexagonus]